MRKVLLLVCLLAASSVFAGTITSLSPSSFRVNSGEYFLTVNGTGTLGNTLVFDGPAGHFERVVNATFAGSVVGWIPEAIVAKSGTHSVKVRAANGAETNSLPFDVVGFRFFPLALLVPDLLFEQARTREGAFVKFDVFPVGGEDPSPQWKCDAQSGDFFKMGQTVVNCEAWNRDKETAKASFTITVADRVAPLVSVPSDVKVRATSPAGAVVDFKATALDAIYGEMPVDCTPRSPSNFRIGKHSVICTSIDPDHNLGSASFLVEVTSDKEPPSLTLLLPELIMVPARDAEGAKVDYKVEVRGSRDPRPAIDCAPKSGSLFPIGATTVTCDVLDADGGWANGSFDVRVIDGNEPLVTSVKSSLSRIPKDGRMWPIELTVEATDDIDPSPTCSILGVSANEDIYPDDEDKPEYDFELTAPLKLSLRGESTRVTRVYNVWVGCFDFFGNLGQNFVQIAVSSDAGAQAEPSGRRRASGKQ